MGILIKPCAGLLLFHSGIGVIMLPKRPECRQDNVNSQRTEQRHGKLQVGLCLYDSSLCKDFQGLLRDLSKVS